MVGYGDSIPAGRGRDISVARQADYLLDWLDAMEIERAVLVGHDLGGGVVQIAAVRDSHRCAGLVLTNAIAYDSWPIPSVRALRAAGGIVERLPDPFFKMLIVSFMVRGHDNLAVGRESGRIHARPYLQHRGMAALIRQIRSLDVQDTIAVQHDLPKLGVPARVVWGAADQFQKVEYGERLASDLDTQLTRIEGREALDARGSPGGHRRRDQRGSAGCLRIGSGWSPTSTVSRGSTSLQQVNQQDAFTDSAFR